MQLKYMPSLANFPQIRAMRCTVRQHGLDVVLRFHPQAISSRAQHTPLCNSLQLAVLQTAVNACRLVDGQLWARPDHQDACSLLACG